MLQRRLLTVFTLFIVATSTAMPTYAANKKAKTAKPTAAPVNKPVPDVNQSTISPDQSSNQGAPHVTIDLSEVGPTKNEVAMLQVISEICPPMLNEKQRVNFAKAYNTELINLMPTISEPKAAMQYFSTQADYQQILHDTRQWVLGFPKADNQELCLELAAQGAEQK